MARSSILGGLVVLSRGDSEVIKSKEVSAEVAYLGEGREDSKPRPRAPTKLSIYIKYVMYKALLWYGVFHYPRLHTIRSESAGTASLPKINDYYGIKAFSTSMGVLQLCVTSLVFPQLLAPNPQASLVDLEPCRGGRLVVELGWTNLYRATNPLLLTVATYPFGPLR